MNKEVKKVNIEKPKPGCSDFLKVVLSEVDVSPLLFLDLPGWPAILRVGEMADPDFFERVKEQHPDGYIIGVGAGVIFSMLEGFDDDTQPKGIVIVDVNPGVIAFAEVLIDELRTSQSQEDFERRFFHQSKDEYQEKFKAKVAGRKSRRFHDQIQICKDLENFRNSPSEVWNEQRYVLRPDMIPIPKQLVQNFAVLKRLADNNNITAIYADITNPQLVQAIRSLPDFSSLANIIYLSNAADNSELSSQDFQKEVTALNSSGRSVFVEAVPDKYDLRLEIVR